MDHPYPWLRYVSADTLEHQDVDFDGIEVESPTGEHLGDVDGFIVDSETARPYYVVADAGGWFKSKHFLLPVGHVRFDQSNEVLRADLTREQVDQFPGFNLNEFHTLTPDELKRLNDETLSACAVSGVAIVASETDSYAAAWDRLDFQYPNWWPATRFDRSPQERASAISGARASQSQSQSFEGEIRERRQALVGHGDNSPHYGGRAQPGDVVGIETEGETTSLGDTSEDEDRRRESAEQAARRRD